MSKSYRELSKINWTPSRNYDDGPTDDMIKLGCLLRIADATELMAKRHQELIDERDAYRAAEMMWEKTMSQVVGEDGPESVANVVRDIQSRCLTANRSNAALRGVITRLRRQLREAKGGA